MIGEINIEFKSLVHGLHHPTFHFDGNFCFKDVEEYIEYNTKEGKICELCCRVDLNPLYVVIMMKLRRANLLKDNEKGVCCNCFNKIKRFKDARNNRSRNEKI